MSNRNLALTVFSFREEAWEPPFLDDLRRLVEGAGHQFKEARNVGGKAAQRFWTTQSVDLILAVSWRYLVPKQVFRNAKYGAYVFHDSLLPAYRGFSPTVWAIANGEMKTGATLLEMEESVDSGQIVDQLEIPISAEDSIALVMDRVTASYEELLDRNLAALLENRAAKRPQDETKATYCCKRLPEDNLIDWKWPAQKVYNHIRALGRPYPGAYTFLNGETLRIWSASLPESPKSYTGIVPGRAIEVIGGSGVQVLAGDGPILLKEVQLGSGGKVSADRVLIRLSYTLG
jgi:methionyl-tRNA formyltransferase